MSREEFFKVPKLSTDSSNCVTFKDRFWWAINAQGMLDQLENVVDELTEPTVSEGTSLPTVYNPTISSITAALKFTKQPIDPKDIIALITDEYDQCDLKFHTKSKKDDK